MRIALLIRALSVGGAERQLSLLARGLANRGHEVTVLVFYRGGKLEGDIVGTPVRLIALDKRGRWDVLGFVWRLVHAVRRSRSQVVYSFLPSSNVLIAAVAPLLGGARIVWGVRSTEMQSASYDWLGSLLARLEAQMTRRVAGIICNSRAALELQMRRGLARDKLVVIRNILDGERFRRDERARIVLREQWRLPPHAVAVGIVARLDPMKGHKVFLQAAAHVARTSESVRFLIIGDGPDGYRGELQRVAEDVGVTEHLAWLPGAADIVPVYSALDVICSASLYGEGFSNALCEGIACGCIGVATDVGDSRDIVARHGEVVKPGDAEALANALLVACNRVATIDRSVMREHILGLCGSNDVLSRTEAALARVVECP